MGINLSHPNVGRLGLLLHLIEKKMEDSKKYPCHASQFESVLTSIFRIIIKNSLTMLRMRLSKSEVSMYGLLNYCHVLIMRINRLNWVLTCITRRLIEIIEWHQTI